MKSHGTINAAAADALMAIFGFSRVENTMPQTTTEPLHNDSDVQRRKLIDDAIAALRACRRENHYQTWAIDWGWKLIGALEATRATTDDETELPELKISQLPNFSGWMAIPRKRKDGEPLLWGVSTLEYWEENGHMDNTCETLNIPRFKEVREAIYEYAGNDMTEKQQANLLRSYGFEIRPISEWK